MRGLLAIIAHDRTKSVEEQEIKDLATAFESLRGQGKRFLINAGDYARVIRINTTDESGIETDGQSWLASFGLLYGQGSRLRQPLELLDGQFALVSFDAATKEVLVATDPFGLQALYIAERDEKTYVSTSSLALAKHLRAKPSRSSVEAFLRAGYHFGSLTHWEEIERLEPGTSIRFVQQGRERRTYWRPAIDETINRLSLKQAADHLIEVATDTFQKYLSSQTDYCTNLTGGYDSRLLNLLLRRAGIRFRTNTRGDDGYPDVRIATLVAKETGWEWLHIRLPNEWPEMQPKMVHTALAWGDGHLDVLELSNAMWQPPEIASDSILLNGGGGELIRNFAWQQEFLKIGKTTQVALDRWIDMRLLHPMDTSVLARDPTALVRDDFGRRMLEWARPHASELNTFQLDMMYAYKCTGHFGLYGPAYGAYGLIQSPLFFRPVFNVATSIHWRHRNGHALFRQMIERLDPRVAAIMTTSGGPAQPMRIRNFHRFLPYYSDIGLTVINKLSEKVLGRSCVDFSDPPGPRLISARQACLSQLENGTNCHATNGNLRSASLYKKPQLDALLRRAQQPRFQEAALLGRILTVELALRATDASFEA